MKPAKSEMAQTRIAKALVLAASFAFRLPELVHAREVNSDSAIVGLQAMHLGRGELSAFLWGSGYQSAIDGYWAVPFFAVLGPTPFALVLSALVLHVIATMAVFSMGERHARLARLPSPAFAGALLAMPLVLTTAAIHTYALYPPRQASITLAMLALVVVDRASGSRKRLVWLGLGGFLSTFACAADPYALVFAPLVALSAFVSAFEGPCGRRSVRFRIPSRTEPPANADTFGKRLLELAKPVFLRLAASTAGGLLGLLPLFLLWRSQGAKLGVTKLDASRIEHNTKLLLETCGPWAFGSTSYSASIEHPMSYAPWDMPHAYALFAKGAVCIFLALFPTALLLSLAGRRLAFATRRAGLTGAVALPLTIYGFLTSVMVMDHFSMRYLASIPLLLPFALAPLVATFGARKLALLVAAPLVAAGVSGWVSFGPDVNGPFVAKRAPGPTDEERVQTFLAEKGVTYAMADYWTAYRVSFVTQERLIVVPTHEKQDRYARHRKAFAERRKVAYLIDPLRSGESPDAVGTELEKGTWMGTGVRVERASVGRFSVFVVER
jgi:hypothetical protein